MKRIDDIKEYLHGNQKGKAANRMEREALSDPFLFEALEGLTSTPGDPLDGLIRLERQLNDRARSSRKQKRTWMYVAASLAILLACGTWWFTWQERTFDEPVMAVAQLSDSVKIKEREVLTLECDKTIDLSDKTDSLIVRQSDRKQLLPLAGNVVRRKDSVREMKMEDDGESMAEAVVTGYGVARKQEVEKSNVKVRGTSTVSGRQNIVLDTLVAGSDVLHFNKYLEKALRYPKVDLDSNKMGVVVLSFELNRKKVPSFIRIEDGFSKESNKEVIRLLAEGPKWENTPSGKRIRASVYLTIGKEGESHKAILMMLPAGSERKP